MAKKIIALLLVLVLTFSLAACGKDKMPTSSTSGNVVLVDSVNNSVTEVSSSQNTSNVNSDIKTEDEIAQQTNSITSSSTTTTSNVSKPTTNDNNDNKDNKDNKDNITALTNLKIQNGTSLTKGLDLKGKTITMAITAEEGQYNTASFKRTIAAFSKKYNCKVVTKQLKFDTYNQQIAQAISSGNSYDICYIHGSMFPSCAIDNLYEPLNDTLRSEDIATSQTSGGIDLNKTSYFVFKGKIWGTCNFSSVFPYVIYYNKKSLSEAGYSGNKDPRKMAESGKWTWKVIETMGRRLTDKEAGIYLLSNSFSYGRAIQLCYGAPGIIADGKGGYKQNITSASYLEALKFKQRLCVGNSAIVEPTDSAHPGNTYETTLSGGAYMFMEETSKYVDMVTDVKNSTAFGRSKANIGIVEVPLAGNNKNRYPTGWLTAVACGEGKDPRVALAWDIFRSKYVDPVNDTNAMSAIDKKYTDNLIRGNIACDIGLFHSSDTNTETIISSELGVYVRNNGDIAKGISDYKDKITACIEYTFKN